MYSYVYICACTHVFICSCLKIESATNISFNSTEEGVLTLVFIESGKKIKINGNSYTSDATGIVTVTLPAGNHTITKADVMNLFYMKLVYSTTSNVENTLFSKIKIYPNPATDIVHIASEAPLKKIEIYTLTGQLVKMTNGNITSLDISRLESGNYLLKLFTGEGVVSGLFVKK